MLFSEKNKLRISSKASPLAVILGCNTHILVIDDFLALLVVVLEFSIRPIIERLYDSFSTVFTTQKDRFILCDIGYVTAYARILQCNVLIK